ncbi:MAG: ATP-binding protein [Quadrisphaera sp.]
MLLGRRRQKQALVAALSGSAAGRGRSILLIGPPGSGFTALLDEVVAAAPGLGDPLVLRARGAGDEAGIPHALLHQVLSPLLAELGDDLDQTRRDALEAAVGVRAPHEGAVPVPLAALGALEVLARRRPVLVVVDDAHLADPDSAAALRFLGRRLSRTAACLVLAHPGPGGPLSTAPADVATAFADEVLVLEPLGDEDATAWADREQSWLDPVQRDALLHLAAGRPRHLADLLQLVGPAAGASAPDGGVRTALRGSALPAVAAARRELQRADEQTRRQLVALGLLDEPAGAPLVARVAGASGAAGHGVDGAGATAAALDPLVAALAAEEADGALVAELRTAWAQHLGEAAAAATAGTAVATRLQAEALRQRALADPAGAPALAAALESAARALRAVDAARSVEVFALAAEHLTGAAERATAAGRAAELALASGRPERARELAERASALADGAGGAARAVTARWSALTALLSGDRETAAGHLEQHLEHPAGAEVDEQELLATAAALVLVAGRSTGGSPALEAAATAGGTGPRRPAARPRTARPPVGPRRARGAAALPGRRPRRVGRCRPPRAPPGRRRRPAAGTQRRGRGPRAGPRCPRGPPPARPPWTCTWRSPRARWTPGACPRCAPTCRARGWALRHAPQAGAAVDQAELLVDTLGSSRASEAVRGDPATCPPPPSGPPRSGAAPTATGCAETWPPPPRSCCRCGPPTTRPRTPAPSSTPCRPSTPCAAPARRAGSWSGPHDRSTPGRTAAAPRSRSRPRWCAGPRSRRTPAPSSSSSSRPWSAPGTARPERPRAWRSAWPCAGRATGCRRASRSAPRRGPSSGSGWRPSPSWRAGSSTPPRPCGRRAPWAPRC